MVKSINRSIKSQRNCLRHWLPHLATAVLAVAVACSSSAMGQPAERRIVIARSGCALAADDTATVDVMFKPGIDRQGRPVTPADLPDHRHDLIRDSVTIILTRDLEELFGIRHDSPLFATDAVLGIVDVRFSDGRLIFNGVPLNDREARALSELCRGTATSR